MVILRNSELKDIIIDESFIEGILWEKEGENLSIKIDWCGQANLENTYDFNKITTFLLFEYVTNLHFDFNFGPSNMGNIEISSFMFKEINNIFEVSFRFNFIPNGFINFYCNDLSFNIIENNNP